MIITGYITCGSVDTDDDGNEIGDYPVADVVQAFNLSG